MDSQYTYMVCTKCLTFNHHAYIEDAMNGFCMQKTNFPFVCVIVDDASTDGEQEVIKNYFDTHFDLSESDETDDYVMTLGRHKTNENCYFVVLYLKYNHYSIKKSKDPYFAKWQNNSKYIALCEGDDYWIAADKLQKQADALESHPECSIAFCTVQMVNVQKEYLKTTIPTKNDIKKNIVNLEDYTKSEYGCGRWTFHTSSFFFRHTLYNGVINIRKNEFKNFPYGDMPLLLYCLLQGKGYYVQQLMSCYRVLSGGYNSYIMAHPDVAIKHQNMLITALNDFNHLTNGKYCKWIKFRILRAEIRILQRRQDFFKTLKFCFWPLYFHGCKNDFQLFLYNCSMIYPKIHSAYKRIKKFLH